jgi:ubiquitin-like 1-activating enzyme E1 B
MARKLKEGIVVFEKDDSICIKFITACSNLRSYLFGISLTNEMEVKKIAGNVVPAIASTNSIVAALEVNSKKKKLENLIDSYF